MSRLLKLAVPIFSVCFSLSVSAARPQLPPAWDGLSVRFDSRTYGYMPPVRIVAQEQADLISGGDLLLEAGNGQADLQNARICVLRSRDGRRPGLLLDFGRELQGGLRIVTGMPADNRPVRVRIRFGESVSEAMCDIDGANGASNDHAVRDFTLTLPWLGAVECGDSGFRFARIDLLDDDRELHLKQVEAVFQYRDIPYIGSFRSSDERLDRIWATGAYTVHLCMQEYLWDGVKRDRLVWVGDLHPEIMTVNSVFGYNEVVPRSLDLARRHHAAAGMDERHQLLFAVVDHHPQRLVSLPRRPGLPRRTASLSDGPAATTLRKDRSRRARTARRHALSRLAVRAAMPRARRRVSSR